MSEHGKTIIIGVVIVPLISLRMYEEDIVRKFVVIIDNEAEGEVSIIWLLLHEMECLLAYVK